MVFLSSELDLSRLSFEGRRDYNNDAETSHSVSLMYDGDRCMFETPLVFCPFSFSDYETQRRSGYALSFNPGVDLLLFFKQLDHKIKEFGENMEWGDYVPIIKLREGKPPLVRIPVKIASLGFVNIEEARNCIPPKSQVKLILQLLPIWVIGGRFGTSFRIRAVQKEQVNFR